jgi:hypothetical protein
MVAPEVLMRRHYEIFPTTYLAGNPVVRGIHRIRQHSLHLIYLGPIFTFLPCSGSSTWHCYPDIGQLPPGTLCRWVISDVSIRSFACTQEVVGMSELCHLWIRSSQRRQGCHEIPQPSHHIQLLFDLAAVSTVPMRSIKLQAKP